jgi:hypothetical protein
MAGPLTPDEDAVMRELQRLDLEPNEIPPELYEGFIQRIADSAGIPLPRARSALQGLIDKDVFDTGSETKEEQSQGDREIIRDLLLYDPEIQDLLRKIVADIIANKAYEGTKKQDHPDFKDQ